MKHPKLKTGMFGETNRGWIFVVVNDFIVYENGKYDTVSTFENDYFGSKENNHYITKLADDVPSFNSYKFVSHDFIFQRFGKKMTIAEIEEELGYKIEIVQPCYHFTDANDKPVDNY